MRRLFSLCAWWRGSVVTVRGRRWRVCPLTLEQSRNLAEGVRAMREATLLVVAGQPVPPDLEAKCDSASLQLLATATRLPESWLGRHLYRLDGIRLLGEVWRVSGYVSAPDPKA